jgi:hypothetical protein
MQNNSLLPLEIIYLPDGTELRLCVGTVPRQGHAKLYCSEQGRFFSLSSRGLNEVHYYQTKNFKAKPNVHSNYPRMCNFIGAPYCHILVAKAWIGPRPEGCELDHLNGITTDNRVCNLQWVTRKENEKRAKLLRVLRSIGRDPKQMSREELLSIFSKYTFTNPQNID